MASQEAARLLATNAPALKMEELMAETCSVVLARFAAELEYAKIPPEVVQSVRFRLLDTVGVCLASVGMEYAKAIADMVREQGGHPEATLFAHPERVPATWAVLHNAALAHGNDYDDTHSVALVHPSGVIIPTTLAVAERVGASGQDAVTAAVAGYEVGLRIGMAVPNRFHARGFHATGVCGTFAAAVTAGRALGLDARGIANAIGIAGSMAAGSMEFLSGGAWTKRMHPGWAAHAGTVAALLAARGYTGPATALEGRFGLFNAYAAPARPDLDRLTFGLGSEWEVLNTDFKPYPCGHISHPYMDCARSLRAKLKLTPEDIEAIELRVPGPAVSILCEPLAEKLKPANSYAARFSLPYAVAVVLAQGFAGIDDFSDERIRDPRILALAARTTYQIDDTLPFPEHFPGWVRLRLRDGRQVEERTDVSRGSRQHPMTDAEFYEKFESNAARTLPRATLGAVWETGLRFDTLGEVTQFTRLLSKS